jgi:hypothetical protein
MTSTGTVDDTTRQQQALSRYQQQALRDIRAMMTDPNDTPTIHSPVTFQVREQITALAQWAAIFATELFGADAAEEERTTVATEGIALMIEPNETV